MDLGKNIERWLAGSNWRDVQVGFASLVLLVIGAAICLERISPLPKPLPITRGDTSYVSVGAVGTLKNPVPIVAEQIPRIKPHAKERTSIYWLSGSSAGVVPTGGKATFLQRMLADSIAAGPDQEVLVIDGFTYGLKLFELDYLIRAASASQDTDVLVLSLNPIWLFNSAIWQSQNDSAFWSAMYRPLHRKYLKLYLLNTPADLIYAAVTRLHPAIGQKQSLDQANEPARPTGVRPWLRSLVQTSLKSPKQNVVGRYDFWARHAYVFGVNRKLPAQYKMNRGGRRHYQYLMANACDRGSWTVDWMRDLFQVLANSKMNVIAYVAPIHPTVFVDHKSASLIKRCMARLEEMQVEFARPGFDIITESVSVLRDPNDFRDLLHPRTGAKILTLVQQRLKAQLGDRIAFRASGQEQLGSQP